MEDQKPDFSGVIDGTTAEKTSLLLDLAHRTPAFMQALELMKTAGFRNRVGASIEIEADRGDAKIVERGFRIMSEHDVTVGLAADALAELVGLDPLQRDLLVSAALFHDVTKRLEVQANGYRALYQQGKVTDTGTSVLRDTFTKAGLIENEDDFAQLQNDITSLSTHEYLAFFGKRVNEQFLKTPLI